MPLLYKWPTMFVIRDYPNRRPIFFYSSILPPINAFGSRGQNSEHLRAVVPLFHVYLYTQGLVDSKLDSIQLTAGGKPTLKHRV